MFIKSQQAARLATTVVHLWCIRKTNLKGDRRSNICEVFQPPWLHDGSTVVPGSTRIDRTHVKTCQVFGVQGSSLECLGMRLWPRVPNASKSTWISMEIHRWSMDIIDYINIIDICSWWGLQTHTPAPRHHTCHVHEEKAAFQSSLICVDYSPLGVPPGY